MAKSEKNIAGKRGMEVWKCFTQDKRRKTMKESKKSFSVFYEKN